MILDFLSPVAFVLARWKLAGFYFQSYGQHVQTVEIVGSLIGEIAGHKYPELSPVFADEFARYARIVKALGFEILGVEQRPRASRRRGRIEFPAGCLPPPFGIVKPRIMPLEHDVEVQGCDVVDSGHAGAAW